MNTQTIEWNGKVNLELKSGTEILVNVETESTQTKAPAPAEAPKATAAKLVLVEEASPWLW